jgi:ribose/xylose/arabinose/galactoside ABC-type transport system permease subunit
MSSGILVFLCLFCFFGARVGWFTCFFRRHWFVLTLLDLWFLNPFCPLSHDGPQVKERHVVSMSRLWLNLPQPLILLSSLSLCYLLSMAQRIFVVNSKS